MSLIILGLGLARIFWGVRNDTIGADKAEGIKNDCLRILPANPRRRRPIDRCSPRKKEGEREDHPSVDYELGETARTRTDFQRQSLFHPGGKQVGITGRSCIGRHKGIGVSRNGRVVPILAGLLA